MLAIFFLIVALILIIATIASDMSDGLGKSMTTRVLFLLAVLTSVAAIGCSIFGE